MLFSVKMNPRDLLKDNAEMDVEVNCHDYMTNEEQEVIQEALSYAAEIVTTAMFRKLSENTLCGVEE